jgi:hypothetical protein
MSGSVKKKQTAIKITQNGNKTRSVTPATEFIVSVSFFSYYLFLSTFAPDIAPNISVENRKNGRFAICAAEIAVSDASPILPSMNISQKFKISDIALMATSGKTSRNTFL